MKKVIKSIVVTALILVTSKGLAKEPSVHLNPGREMSLNFEMDAALEQTVLRIISSEGTIVFTENIKAGNTYSKRFDLKNLTEGAYFLTIENTLKEKIFGFTVADSVVRITEERENAKPVFRQKGTRLFLNLLNLEKERVRIKIFDSEDRVVFQETIENKMLVEKVFNFEKAFEDNYTVVVKNSNDTYYEAISVK